jgi:hypothetical protein
MIRKWTLLWAEEIKGERALLSIMGYFDIDVGWAELEWNFNLTYHGNIFVTKGRAACEACRFLRIVGTRHQIPEDYSKHTLSSSISPTPHRIAVSSWRPAIGCKQTENLFTQCGISGSISAHWDKEAYLELPNICRIWDSHDGEMQRHLIW